MEEEEQAAAGAGDEEEVATVDGTGVEEAAGGEEEPSVVRGWDAGSGMKVVRVTTKIRWDAARHKASTGPGVFYRAWSGLGSSPCQKSGLVPGHRAACSSLPAALFI